MAKASQAQEPSMEEILASIRRIISDDETIEAEPSASLDPQSLSTDAIDALFGARLEAVAEPSTDADAPVKHPDEPPAAARRAASPVLAQPQPQPQPAEEHRAAAPAPLRPQAPQRPATAIEPAPVADELPAGRPLLSPAADAAVTSAFGDLAHTLLSGQARTLEDLVKDMLRPMLKSWLDSNLPPLVERLVRDEIERVSRGR